MATFGSPLACGACPLSERAKRGPNGRLELHCDISGQARGPRDKCNAPTKALLRAVDQAVAVIAERHGGK